MADCYWNTIRCRAIRVMNQPLLPIFIISTGTRRFHSREMT